MNEIEWTLRKENAALKSQLAQVQSQLCQLMFDAANKDSAELGEAWTEPVAEPVAEPEE